MKRLAAIILFLPFYILLAKDRNHNISFADLSSAYPGVSELERIILNGLNKANSYKTYLAYADSIKQTSKGLNIPPIATFWETYFRAQAEYMIVNYEEAMCNFALIKELVPPGHTFERALRAWVSIAEYTIHIEKGDTRSALASLVEAQNLALTIPDSLLYAIIKLEKGYIDQNAYNRLESALSNATFAKRIFEKYQDTSKVGAANFVIATIYLHQGKAEKAETLYYDALKSSLKYKDTTKILEIYIKLSGFEIRKKNIRKAFFYAEEIRRLSLDVNDNYFYIWSLIHLGELNNLQNKPQPALNYLKQALLLSKKYDFSEHYSACLELISRAYIALNQADSAVNYFNRYISLKNSSRNKALLDSSANLNVKFEMVQRYKKIHLQEMQITSQTKRINNSILVGVAVLSIVLIFVFATIYYRLRMEKQLNQQLMGIQSAYLDNNRLLAMHQRELNMFATVATQDFRHPLANMNRHIAEFSTSTQVTAHHQFIQIIQKSLANLNDLIQGFSIYLEARKKPLEKTQINARAIAERLIGEFQEKYHNANIIIDPLPSVTATEFGIYQLFKQLIDNGLRFSLHKEIPSVHVSAQIHPEGITITFQDWGMGIPTEYKDYVFGLFKQLDKKNKSTGLGLGLSIAYKIVENLNGKIWFESEINQGSRFYVFIPQLLTHPG